MAAGGGTHTIIDVCSHRGYRLVHNSDEEELERKLKEAIMSSDYLLQLERQLEAALFPTPESMNASSELLVSGASTHAGKFGLSPSAYVVLPHPAQPCMWHSHDDSRICIPETLPRNSTPMSWGV